MINFSVLKFRQKRYMILSALLFSIAIGFAVSFQPLNSFAVLGVLLAAAAFLIKPAGIPLALLLVSAVTLDFVFGFTIAGFDAGTLYKLSIIMIIILCWKLYGATFQFMAPLIVLSIILMLTYTFADFHPRLGSISPFISFLGMGAPFLILLVKWDRKLAGHIILLITLLPLVSIIAGVILQFAGLHEVMHQEYLGANRLQGANIAAHLAMLAFVGFGASIIEIKRRDEMKLLFFVLAALNFVIIFSTGTRGALVASVFIIAVFVFDYIKDYLKGKLFAVIPLALFILTFIVVLLTQWENIMMRSFNAHSTDIGINISGRDVAWSFFLAQSRGSEIFGQGLGASLTANDGSLYDGFTVPHNEYIRFFFDSGIIGMVLFFAALLYVLVKVGLKLPTRIAFYYFSLIFGFLIYTFVDNTLTTIHFIVPFLFFIAALHSLYDTEGMESGKLNLKERRQQGIRTAD